MRILAENEPRYGIATSLPVATGAECRRSELRFCTHSNGKKHRKYRVFWQLAEWRVSSLHFFIALRAASRARGRGLPSHFIHSSACKKCYPRRICTHRRAKITQNTQQRAGLAAKSTPPVPRGSYFTRGMPHAKGRVCFCRRVAYFQKQLFF